MPDAQAAFEFHSYCLQSDATVVPLAPLAETCSGSVLLDQHAEINIQADYARQQLKVPAFVGDFSASDNNGNNAALVDRVGGGLFLTWTIWSYYTYSSELHNNITQGLLIDDTQSGSQANVKQEKLDAIVVP